MNEVVVYVSSVANYKKHPRKIDCLLAFAEGVQKLGCPVHVEYEHRYTPSRVALILGWATTNTGGPNITLRKQIIAEQQARGQYTMCIDASCWKYLDNRGNYLRYSVGGPFYDRAEYANHNSNDAHWKRIQQDLGVSMKPQRINDGYVLVCIQRDGGFAMKTLNPVEWAKNKIIQIRQYTDRKIVVRPHPGESKNIDFSELQNLGVKVLDPKSSTLLDNLQSAHSAVFFNSSASVAAVCEGVPIFVDDASCVSWLVANKDIAKIETPDIFNRDQWINDLASAHWTDEDGKQGLIYKKFLPFLNHK